MPFIGENLLRPRMFHLQAMCQNLLAFLRPLTTLKSLVMGGGGIAQWLAHLLPDPAAPGSILSIPQLMFAEVN